MVDPQPRNLSPQQHLKDQMMTLLEDAGVFHADRRQVVDVEEAAIVDLIAGNLPIGQAVNLGVQEAIEFVKALRITGGCR